MRFFPSLQHREQCFLEIIYVHHSSLAERLYFYPYQTTIFKLRYSFLKKFANFLLAAGGFFFTVTTYSLICVLPYPMTNIMAYTIAMNSGKEGR